MEDKIERNKDNSPSSLVRGLLVLESFGKQGRYRFTLAELSKGLNVPKTTMYRILRTLVEMDYLRYEEHSKHYYLGVRVLSLGFTVLSGMELREIARPYMEKLSHECNKTVNLAVLDREEMVYVERVSVRSLRQYNISVGTRMSPWNTAVGKAVLAHLEQKHVLEMLQNAKNKGTLTVDETTFLRELEKVRKDGFAVNNQDTRPGIMAIAVPIFSEKGVVGAINMIAEPEEITFEMFKRDYAPKLLELGHLLSKALGHRA